MDELLPSFSSLFGKSAGGEYKSVKALGEFKLFTTVSGVDPQLSS